MTIEKLKKYNIFKEELLSLELLKNQGFNNISYLLKTTKKIYVIRVFKSNESVNISREFEYKIQKKAYKKNIASKPIFLNKEFMIYEYEKGIHKTKLSNFELKELILKVKKYKYNFVLTHHDLNPKNIIFNETGFKIIDWEYAGMNDSFFDLASICIEFKLNKNEEKIVLNSYFKTKKSYHKIKLKHYKIIYDSFCKLWFEANS